LRIEELENRVVPSTTRLETLFAHSFASGTPALAPFNPGQIRHAYGIDQINFGSITGDGSGQTIAIVDAYNAPHIQSDLAAFDQAFRLPAPPSFKVINQSGGTRLPRNNAGWALEASLDVEWVHATAPKANLLLVEANTNSYADLFAAVTTAASHSGVSVVSMSFGGGEFSGETSYDSVFMTPSGHQGVSFVASAGDSGAPAQYPSASPNVLSVGGTSLSIDSAGNYISEVGWNNSTGATGGGPSAIEGEPAYQVGVQSTGARGTPDVSLVADPNTGVYVYDSYGYGGWLQVGGTSLSAPVWAGLIGIANQGRAANKLNTLTNAPADVYTLPAGDFHDVTTGNNGYSAGTGYDLVTGLGTPRANLVVTALASPTLSSAAVKTAAVHTTTASKPTPPAKTPPPTTTAALFIVPSAPTPFVPASALAPLATQAAVARDVLVAQLTAQQLYLSTPTPPNAPGHVTISEQTLQLAHSDPDRTDNTSMKPDDTDKQDAPSGAPLDLPMDIVPLSGLLPGESVSRTRDFFFSEETGSAAGLGATLQVETLEQIDDTLEPAVMAGLLLLAGSSWRAATEESRTRRCTALQI
jgi:hypothetical protein